MFSCNGILFNHESPMRGETFVTRKITRAVARIKLGFQEKIYLGNLDAKRDWGHAADFVKAMWLMLQQDQPEDFVIATGQTRTVREFVENAFAEIGVEIAWRGQGVDEVGYDKADGQVRVEIDSRYFRPTEVDLLLGDPSKAKEKMGWEPETSFADMVKAMVAADLMEAQRDNFCQSQGFKVYAHEE